MLGAGGVREHGGSSQIDSAVASSNLARSIAPRSSGTHRGAFSVERAPLRGHTVDTTVPDRVKVLQQEIAGLRKANEAYSSRARHSNAEKVLRRQREIRIEQILYELSGLVDRLKRSVPR